MIEFAEDVLRITLFPWQRWLLVHALELRAGSGFRFRNVVVLVARQNGKSTLSQVLALWFMYVYGYQLVLGTAQDLDTADEVWQGAVDLVTEMTEDGHPVRPELHELYLRTVLVNGKKSLDLTTGARYKAKAASRRSGRGLSGDLVLLDELREHQTWDAWGAITKTTMARDDAMVWALSNAGDGKSVVLAYLRKMAHAALDDPDGINTDELEQSVDEVDPEDFGLDDEDDSLGIFEWSAPPGCDINDRAGWAAANPSLGHKISARTIASAARLDPEPIFRTEVLCQWVETLEPTSDLDVSRWLTLADPSATPGRPVFGVDQNEDRAVSIGCAWRRPDRVVQVMLSQDERVDVGLSPVAAVARLAELHARWGGRVVLGGPAVGLELDLRTAGVPSQVLTGPEFAMACGYLDDRIREGTVHHGNQDPLNESVASARWRSTGSSGERAFQLKDAATVGPVAAVVRALSGLLSRPTRVLGPESIPAAPSSLVGEVQHVLTQF